MDPYQPPPSSSSLFQLNLDANNGYTLRSAASWAKVLAVVGIIFSILFIAAGILTYNNSTDGGYRSRGAFGSAEAMTSLITFCVTGLIYLLGSVFALNFANRISRALKTNDQQALNSGFAGLRNYFAFWAILLIIALLFTLILIAGVATGGGLES